MNIGFSLSNNQGLANVQDVVSVAARAEELGYDSVWASDHVFNVSYVYERLGNRPYYDPLTILTFAAAQTRRVILGTSVLVLPYHNPMRLAKQAATLDQLSGGRVALGVGVGVIDTEIEAMGVPFAERGPYSDESIDIMKTLWCDDDPRYEGRFFQFEGMAFSPRPVRPEGIPLIIGGPAAPPSVAPPATATAGIPRPCRRRTLPRESGTCTSRPTAPTATPLRSPSRSACPCREAGPGDSPSEPNPPRCAPTPGLSPTSVSPASWFPRIPATPTWSSLPWRPWLPRLCRPSPRPRQTTNRSISAEPCGDQP